MKRLSPLTLLLALLISACGGSNHAATPPQVQPGQHVYAGPFGPSPHPPGWGDPGVPAQPQRLRSSQTVEMFDTITPSTVPGDARVLAGYLPPSSWPDYNDLVRGFPHAKVKSIAVAHYVAADCLDIEPGDASPSAAPGWYRAQRARGIKPCLYTSLSGWPAVYSYMDGAGISRSSYWKWEAHYTYSAGIDSGFDGTQWTDRSRNSNLDESTITLAFAGLINCDAACQKRKHDALVRTWRKNLAADYATRTKIRTQLSWSRRGFSCRHTPKHTGCPSLLEKGRLINVEIVKYEHLLHVRHVN